MKPQSRRNGGASTNKRKGTTHGAALLNGSMRCVALAHDVTSTIRRGKNVYAILMGSSVLDSSLSSYLVRGSFIQVR